MSERPVRVQLLGTNGTHKALMFILLGSTTFLSIVAAVTLAVSVVVSTRVVLMAAMCAAVTACLLVACIRAGDVHSEEHYLKLHRRGDGHHSQHNLLRNLAVQ